MRVREKDARKDTDGKISEGEKVTSDFIVKMALDSTGGVEGTS